MGVHHLLIFNKRIVVSPMTLTHTSIHQAKQNLDVGHTLCALF